jgi:hypothetical protein
MLGVRLARLIPAAAVVGALALPLAATAGASEDPGPALPAPIMLPALPSAPFAPPTLPESSPAVPEVLAPAPSPPSGIPLPPAGNGGSDDPCSGPSSQAAEAGAPIAASCPLTQTDDGGGDGSLCVDVALDNPSCASAQAVDPTTPTTTAPTDPDTPGAPTPGNGDGASSSPTAEATAAVDPAVTAAAGPAAGSPTSMPFTGVDALGIAGVGGALAAVGAGLARVRRRVV